MDEARTVIRRLERIEALRSDRAPAAELLGEVRKLLREGEAWLAAERGSDGPGETRAVAEEPTGAAAAALASCRRRLRDGEVMPEKAGSVAL